MAAAPGGLPTVDISEASAARFRAGAPTAGHRPGLGGIGSSGATRPIDTHRERGELAEPELADGV